MVGQDHWRAKLTDHEVELIRSLLAERVALVARLRTDGAGQGVVEREVRRAGLSYTAIAVKFEVSKSTVRDIVVDRRRVQVSWRCA